MPKDATMFEVVNEVQDAVTELRSFRSELIPLLKDIALRLEEIRDGVAHMEDLMQQQE